MRFKWLAWWGKADRVNGQFAGRGSSRTGRAGLDWVRLMHLSPFCFRVLVTSLVFTQERKSSLQQRIWFVKLPEVHFFFWGGGRGGVLFCFIFTVFYLFVREGPRSDFFS